ncbi:hypothetical protein SORBI_3001G296600 [Sorghum bicolor]|uniref:Uncharacterized protein n=1 Tax=Sorghum bicolor TaxID=4558 RepID=A0A1B6QLW7_SORBI|nr:hypothetical protein SORBI_3001G296600 [Sorghum bicolor]
MAEGGAHPALPWPGGGARPAVRCPVCCSSALSIWVKLIRPFWWYQTNPHLVRIFSTGLDPGLVTSDPNTPESGLNLLQPFGPSIQTHATSSTKVN